MRRNITVSGLIILGLVIGGGALCLLLPRPEGRLHVTVERVEFRREVRPVTRRWLPNSPARLPNSNEEMLTVYMFLSPEGRPPSWWFDDAKAQHVGMDIEDLVITDEQGKQKTFPTFVSEDGRTNSSEMPRYYSILTCYVPKKSSLKGYTLKAGLSLINIESVQFQVPIDNIGTQPVDMTASVTTPRIKILGKGLTVS